MLQFVRDLYLNNPVFAGMVSAGILAGVLFQLRALPRYAWRLFSNQFLLILKVHHDERAYREMSLWLSRHPDGQKARRVQMTHVWDPTSEKLLTMTTPGAGWHRIREDGRTFFVRREVKEPGPDAGMMGTRMESLTLYTLGRDPSVFAALVEKTSTIFEDKNSIAIYTATSTGGFTLAGRRTKRSLDTIDVPIEIKERIVTKINEFMSQRERYGKMAIPWRLTLLLEGIPGSGKSSLIAAIASLLNKPIHFINPAIMEKDSNVQDALTNAGAGLVVFEDVDSVEALHQRKFDEDGAIIAKGEPKEAGTGLTLSGFLNAFDGVASHEGRIMILTSNHADVLDSALLRAGRVNLRLNIGAIEAPEIVSMYARLNPGQTITLDQAAPWVGMAPAAVQELMLDGQSPAQAQPLALVA